MGRAEASGNSNGVDNRDRVVSKAEAVMASKVFKVAKEERQPINQRVVRARAKVKAREETKERQGASNLARVASRK